MSVTTEFGVAHSVPDAAQALGLGLTTVKELVASGALRSFRIGRRALVSRKALIEFIEVRERRG